MPLKNPQDLPHNGKLIAFDVGKKTLGIAGCDLGRRIANPLTTIQRSSWQKEKIQIEKLCTSEQPVAFIVGLPLTMGGDFSSSTDAAHSFADLLEKTFCLPVLLWDERFTTSAATSSLFEQRQGRQKRASKKDIKAQVDAVAAALILQGVLDNLAFSKPFV